MEQPRQEGSGVDSRFVKALVGADFPALAQCLAADVRFRALVPRGLREASGAADATKYFQAWFGPPKRLDLLDERVSSIADRGHLAWRLRVQDETGVRVIEQQAYITVRDGLIVELDVLCSGFRAPCDETVEAGSHARAVIAAARLDGGDAGCATLTPMVKARLRDLASGEILEVVSGEPGAARDLESWCRLTGHALIEPNASGMRFYIRKK